jgi:hypothetical protein
LCMCECVSLCMCVCMHLPQPLSPSPCLAKSIKLTVLRLEQLNENPDRLNIRLDNKHIYLSLLLMAAVSVAVMSHSV